jgi:hypothetical protein
VRRVFRAVLDVLARLVASLAILWAAAALWIDGPESRLAAGALAGSVALAGLGLAWLPRPAWRAALAAAVPFLLVLGWWFAIPPRQDRAWQADVARPAWAEFDGSRVTIHNVRDFAYAGADRFTERWETRTYDLDDVRGFDLFLDFWGPTLYAHTIASWEFADGRHLAISIEARKEVGESYSAVRSFFRQFELYYVVGDERDLIGVRAGQRDEDLFLYRLRAPPAAARALLVSYLEEINRLAERPEWYNAITHNCTTRIQRHVREVAPDSPWDWRILANGYLDRFMHDEGVIDTTLPFEELRARSYVSERANAAAGDPAFSRRLREGLPARPPPPG